MIVILYASILWAGGLGDDSWTPCELDASKCVASAEAALQSEISPTSQSPVRISGPQAAPEPVKAPTSQPVSEQIAICLPADPYDRCVRFTAKTEAPLYVLREGRLFLQRNVGGTK